MNKKLEEFNNKLKVSNIAIIGLGVSNIPLLDYLHDMGCNVTVFNTKELDSNLLEKLDISGVTVLNDRIENIKEKEGFDIVTSRAVSELRILAELSLPYLKIGGKVIALKSHVDEELLKASDTTDILGGSKPKIIDINLPEALGKRCFVEITKEKPTEKIYPRIYDKILKYPLKKNSK